MDKNLTHTEAVAFVARYGITRAQFELAHQHNDTLPPVISSYGSKGYCPTRYDPREALT